MIESPGLRVHASLEKQLDFHYVPWKAQAAGDKSCEGFPGRLNEIKKEKHSFTFGGVVLCIFE